MNSSNKRMKGKKDVVVPEGEPHQESVSDSIAKAETIVAGMPQRPAIRHGMRKAFYTVHDDTISLPSEKDFQSSANYYAALFHELIHATGHETRLNRTSIVEGNGFGSDPYCKEELIAELGAAFLCGHVGIVDRTIDNSAAYIQGWLSKLRADKTLVVQAAAQAEKAVNFILGVSAQIPPDETSGANNPPDHDSLKLPTLRVV